MRVPSINKYKTDLGVLHLLHQRLELLVSDRVLRLRGGRRHLRGLSARAGKERISVVMGVVVVVVVVGGGWWSLVGGGGGF